MEIKFYDEYEMFNFVNHEFFFFTVQDQKEIQVGMLATYTISLQQ
jgi:hypothetical protein